MSEDRLAALVEQPELCVLEVSGKDRARFINGMCTNDIKGLKPEKGRMAALVTRQGKMVIVGIFRATNSALLFTVDRTRLQPTIDHLSKFIVTDDVVLKDAGLNVLYLHGPRASDILAIGDLGDFNHCEEPEGVIVSPNRTLAETGHDLLVPADKVKAVCDRITAGGGLPRPAEELEALRIASGFPRWGVDMDENLLPMEAGLDDVAISYSKGCYIGQEVIQRIKTYSESPRLLVSLALEGRDATAAGTEVLADGKAVGKITSVAGSSAIALVRKEQKAPGTRVKVGDRSAEVIEAPWKKRIQG